MTEIVVRPLADAAERQACVALQEATWGDGFVDRVPSSILMIAQETGGVASGAFHGDTLVGFVFGISGIRDGRRVHWSDMLAVLPAFRDRGIGYQLKSHQRDLLLANGIETVFWTFDPLVARNAYLNLLRLGVIARTYKRDLYGRATSPLHASIGTDRLLAEWWIASDRVRRSLAGERTPRSTATARGLINPPTPGDAPHPAPGDATLDPDAEEIEIAIPGDIQALKDADPALGQAWRENVRAAFEAAFRAGYVAVDLLRGEAVARYVLVADPHPGGTGPP